MKRGFKLGLVQLSVVNDKAANLSRAAQLVRQAAEQGASVISLPECFNCPYSNDCFAEYSEPIPDLNSTIPLEEFSSDSPSISMMSALSKELGIFLIGGSIPERELASGHIYNSSAVFSPKGKLIAKHRKVHLFDISIPHQITFRESDTLTAGNSVTCFETPFCKIGLGICYDMRFPEYSIAAGKQGAELLVFPGAFNTTTGPAHWELLQRARAVDNQVYVAAVSPARVPGSSYQAWGHSTVCSPWGEVLDTLGHEEGVIVVDIDLARVEEVRQQIPVLTQKRMDVY